MLILSHLAKHLLEKHMFTSEKIAIEMWTTFCWRQKSHQWLIHEYEPSAIMFDVFLNEV